MNRTEKTVSWIGAGLMVALFTADGFPGTALRAPFALAAHWLGLIDKAEYMQFGLWHLWSVTDIARLFV